MHQQLTIKPTKAMRVSLPSPLSNHVVIIIM